MIDQKQISNYLRQAKKNCPFSFRKKLSIDLEASISDYIDANPSSTITELTEHFGSPERFSLEYLVSMDDVSLKAALNKTKWIKRGILLCVALVLIFCTVTATVIIIENSRTAVRYYTEIIIE